MSDSCNNGTRKSRRSCRWTCITELRMIGTKGKLVLFVFHGVRDKSVYLQSLHRTFAILPFTRPKKKRSHEKLPSLCHPRLSVTERIIATAPGKMLAFTRASVRALTNSNFLSRSHLPLPLVRIFADTAIDLPRSQLLRVFYNRILG